MYMFNYELSGLAILTTIFVLGASLVPLLLWAALPKPIPGIPYNKVSAGRIFGDTADMVKEGRVRAWMRDQFILHNSPILQVFTSPFTRPWVLVSDFREAQDIMMRRTHEFDKSKRTVDSFIGVMRNSFVSMKTSDPRFKHHKELLKDLMMTKFLNEVSAPEIYEKTTLLLNLWTIKSRYSNKRPFKADRDIHMAALDIIMTVAFDYSQSETMLVKQIESLQGHAAADSIGSEDEPFPFEDVPLGPDLHALVFLSESIGVAFQSIVPRFAHWLYLQKSEAQKALRTRKQFIKRNIEQSIKRLENPEKDRILRCAVDKMLLREREFAEKSGIQPDFHKSAIYDELFGYIAGGTDTTSTTIAWLVKFMTREQKSQLRLRQDLHNAHAAALFEGRLPTATEISRAHIPFLEATIEETFRYTTLVPTLIRESLVDTKILGNSIPKGTMVFLCINSQSFMQAPFVINEDKRSESSRLAKDQYGEWDPADMGDFVPERWLRIERKEEDSKIVQREVFDSHAGPQISFGAGPRSCFGRKLAYVEMRIALTLLIWTFEFLPIEGERNSMEVLESFTLQPKHCYVKLKKIEPTYWR